jgi:hypothetical protein
MEWRRSRVHHGVLTGLVLFSGGNRPPPASEGQRGAPDFAAATPTRRSALGRTREDKRKGKEGVGERQGRYGGEDGDRGGSGERREEAAIWGKMMALGISQATRFYPKPSQLHRPT